MQISASSVEGCSKISGSEQASVCYNSALPGWNVVLDLPMTSAKDGSIHRLKATFSILATAESLAVLLQWRVMIAVDGFVVMVFDVPFFLVLLLQHSLLELLALPLVVPQRSLCQQQIA